MYGLQVGRVERNENNKEGYEPLFQGFKGKTRGAISFGIRGIGVSVTQVEVSRDVASGLGSKSKKWKLVVGGPGT